MVNNEDEKTNYINTYYERTILFRGSCSLTDLEIHQDFNGDDHGGHGDHDGRDDGHGDHDDRDDGHDVHDDGGRDDDHDVHDDGDRDDDHGAHDGGGHDDHDDGGHRDDDV
ncbi:hypothetical protein CDAR_573571 [Caerostris darwini]|uniref:Uncharacterized protein n=1 Tax=Caerostris darwini TaxID=1538125 RepID=A0AAV4TDW1_9ARAC|nr:hypothetical protein CDAR_573571 [Caerostris darwini]